MERTNSMRSWCIELSWITVAHPERMEIWEQNSLGNTRWILVSIDFSEWCISRFWWGSTSEWCLENIIFGWCCWGGVLEFPRLVVAKDPNRHSCSFGKTPRRKWPYLSAPLEVRWFSRTRIRPPNLSHPVWKLTFWAYKWGFGRCFSF